MAMPAAAAGDIRYRCPGLPGTLGMPGGRTCSCASLRRCTKIPCCMPPRGLGTRLGVEARLPARLPPAPAALAKRSCEFSRRHSPGEGARLPLPPPPKRYEGEFSLILHGEFARPGATPPPTQGAGAGDMSRPRCGVEPRAEPIGAPIDGLLCLRGVATPAAQATPAPAAGWYPGEDLLGRTSWACVSRFIQVFGFKSITMRPSASTLTTVAGSQSLCVWE